MSETPPLKAAVIPVTPYQQNCSLVWCTRTMRGAFVDPGGETEKLKELARLQGVTIEKILLTHGHLDHASGAAKLAREHGVKVEGPHRDDQFLLDDLGRNAKRPGFGDAENCTPDRWLEDNDTVTIGEVTLGVRHCPGHTPGHVVFYHEGVRIAFVGDVLFRGSIGRCDLPRGDWNQLINAITSRLFPLGDDITFVSGHGEMSTFGWERKTNPYVSDLALGITRELGV
ncbi:MAG TPA: MBL fold metallo-hydrolase [Rhizomicrobium sp.]|jgi:glyoxylase-like metal-dependent hydrolase (beta-lactamase superfamily II)